MNYLTALVFGRAFCPAAADDLAAPGLAASLPAGLAASLALPLTTNSPGLPGTGFNSSPAALNLALVEASSSLLRPALA